MTQWEIGYQLPFEDLDGQQYCVYIYDSQGIPAEIVTLTGSDEPFVTQEDDDDDIFKNIRSQSGYLRIIDEDGTLMEQLFANNNTSSLVKLFAGTWNDQTKVFTPSTLEWVGFIRAESYSQRWGDYNQEVEIPVRSIIGTLNDIMMGNQYLTAYDNFAKLWVKAMETIGYTPEYMYIACDTLSWDNWLSIMIEWSLFFDEETFENEGTTTSTYFGCSFMEALGSVLSLFGLMCREYKGNIYIMQYDKPQNVRIYEFMWDDVELIADGGGFIGEDYPLTSRQMMDSITFMDTHNLFSNNGGRSSVKISLSLDSDSTISFTPDAVVTDSSTVYERTLSNGTLYGQLHEPANATKEKCYFWKFNKYTSQGESNFSFFCFCSLLDGYSLDPYYTNDVLVTGAAPVRWFFRTGTESVVLRDGLYLQTQYHEYNNSNPPNVYKQCYSISSDYSFYRLRDGYININFHLDSVTLAEWNKTALIRRRVYCALQAGNKFWNGSAWVTGSATTVYFYIDVESNGNITTNKDSTMLVDKNEGYFVPIQTGSGVITLHILNIIDSPNTTPVIRLSTYAHIMTNLSVEFLTTYESNISQRSSNNYYKKILMSGFNGAETIDLKIGTWNNNVDNRVFIKDSNSRYIESWQYKKGSGSVTERPEIHLLNRMAEYYVNARRTYECTIAKGVDLLTSYYIYDNRYFLAVSKQRNWRDATEKVKFIEITQ